MRVATFIFAALMWTVVAIIGAVGTVSVLAATMSVTGLGPVNGLAGTVALGACAVAGALVTVWWMHDVG